MFHQRNVLAAYYVIAALAAFALSAAIGSIFLSVVVVAIVSLPIIFLIKKILPAPDWYRNEDEGSKMTSLNLTAAHNNNKHDDRTG